MLGEARPKKKACTGGDGVNDGLKKSKVGTQAFWIEAKCRVVKCIAATRMQVPGRERTKCTMANCLAGY